MGPGITIGDVLTVIGLLFGTLGAIWALLVGFALLFPIKAERARSEIQENAWRAFGIGLGYTLALAFLAIVFSAPPNPIAKIIGFWVYSALIGTMLVGGSGLALVAADRIQSLERRRSGYRSLERGALLLVVGSILPVFGWFAFAPVVMIVSAGAGARSLFARRKARQPVSAKVQELRDAAAAGETNKEFVV